MNSGDVDRPECDQPALDINIEFEFGGLGDKTNAEPTGKPSNNSGSATAKHENIQETSLHSSNNGSKVEPSGPRSQLKPTFKSFKKPMTGSPSGHSCVNKPTHAKGFSQPQSNNNISNNATPPTDSEVQSLYFAVMWCKKSARKVWVMSRPTNI